MKKNRIIALLLAVFMGTSILTGCKSEVKVNEKSPETNEKTEEKAPVENPADETQNGADKAEFIGLDAYDWKYADDEVMMTIGGIPFTFGEYRFFAMGYKETTDGGDDAYWTDENEKQYKDSFAEQFKVYAAIKLYADSNNITLNDEDHAFIDDTINGIVEQNGENAFEQSYITKETYRKLCEYDVLTMKLPELFMPTDEAVMEVLKEDYVHVQHVLVSTVDENNVSLSEEVIAEKKALADTITEKARNGEDFYSLVEQYGEDPGMKGNPDGYTFTYGMMVEEFETKSYELEVGEISDPVKTPFGYHIIKKLPLELTNESEEFIQLRDSLANEALSMELYGLVEDMKAEYTEAFETVTMKNIGVLKQAE